MSDMTANSAPRTARNSRRRNAEFTTYFVLVFIAALPFAFFAWGRQVIRQRTLNLRGPLALAWAEADRITPLIFSAGA